MGIACHGLSECKSYNEQEDRITELEQEVTAWKKAVRLWGRVSNFQEGDAMDRAHDAAVDAERDAKDLERAHS